MRIFVLWWFVTLNEDFCSQVDEGEDFVRGAHSSA